MLMNYLRGCARINCTIRSFSRPVVRNLITQNKTPKSTNIKLTQQLFIKRLQHATNNNNATHKSAAKLKLKKGDVARLISLASKEKLILTVAVGCLLVSSAISMSVPFALGKILNIIFHTEDNNEQTIEKLKQFSTILAGVFLVGGLANFGRVYLFNSASLRIVQNLRARVYSTMLKQETGWFDTKGTGELLNRLMNDTYLMGQSLSQNLSDGLRSLTMLLAGTGMMIYASPELALVSSVVVPAVAGMAIVYGRYVKNITRSLLDKFADISKNAEERLGNVKTVKTFCREDEESKLFQSKLDAALALGYKDVRARSIFFGLTGFSGNFIILSILYYGSNLVAQEALSVGALTSFILYAAYTGMSMNGLSNFYTELSKGVGAAQRIWEILDRDYKIPVSVGQIPAVDNIKGEVVFENVSFQFPTRPDNHVLKQFSLVLHPGETTAIVGRSGTGKSTIASLLLRLYDPLKGRILLDGWDLRDLNPLWLRSHIGAVSQEPVLFSGTIRDNILYGLKPGTEVNEKYFEEAVRRAHVLEFTTQLPQGLNTLVGQRGLMLSGGQRQRVAIARALIKNPTILILDEATSALDSVSETLVQNALQELAKGRTVLTIAHRLSTIRNAHKIAVLNNGIVAEQGRYEDLILRDEGVFKELVAKQAFLMSA